MRVEAPVDPGLLAARWPTCTSSCTLWGEGAERLVRAKPRPSRPTELRPTPPAFDVLMISRLFRALPLFVLTAALGRTPAVAEESTATAFPMAAAHQPGQAYMFLRIYDDSIVVRLEILEADLEEALGLGWDVSQPLTRERIAGSLDRIRAYAEPRFSLVTDGQRLEPSFRDFDLRPVDFGEYVLLEYLLRVSPTPPTLDITYTPLFEVRSQHRNMLVVEHNWRTGTFNNEGNVSLIWSARDPTQTLDLTRSSVWRGFWAFVRSGMWHIWVGIDHILFLVALTLPSVLRREGGRWMPVESFRRALLNIVTIVTFFTIAHSITLSLAALDVIRLPSTFVETVIALSIAAAALHNLAPSFKVKEATIAFAFGLFHGFGFASVLGEMGLGREYLVLSLLGFNVGVEIGQVVIITALFPVLFLLRRTTLYGWILRLGSAFLIAVALLWAAERTFGFNVPLVPIARRLLGWLPGI